MLHVNAFPLTLLVCTAAFTAVQAGASFPAPASITIRSSSTISTATTGGINENAGYNACPMPGFYFGPDLLGHGIIFRGMKLD